MLFRISDYGRHRKLIQGLVSYAVQSTWESVNNKITILRALSAFLVSFCFSVKQYKEVAYTFKAEFIAPPKPSIDYEKPLVSTFTEWKIHSKKGRDPSPQKSVPLQGGIGHATPSWRFVCYFVFFRHRRDSFFDWATGSPIISLLWERDQLQSSLLESEREKKGGTRPV